MQIHPKFVREAYNLLRQSIIHVESDEVELDDDADDDVQPTSTTNGQHPPSTDDDDMNLDGDDMTGPGAADSTFASMEAAPSTPMATPSRPGRAPPQQLVHSTPAAASAAPAPAPPKQKLKISHDKFVAIQNMVVIHLSQVEQTTYKGLTRDELIDWYLERNESQFVDEEEMDREQKIFEKVLNKLVKVRHDTGSTGLLSDHLRCRTTT